MSVRGVEVVSRYEKLKNDRYNFDDRWDRMAPYLAPTRIGIQTKLAKGESQVKRVYDSTMMFAAEIFSMFIAGNVINPAQQWFGLKMNQSQFRESDAIREWLEEVRNLMLKSIAQSSFYAEASEALIDYGGFGTASLLTEEMPQAVNEIKEGFRGLRFQTDKIGRFWIAEGPSGKVDTNYRVYELTADVIMRLWGNDPLAKVPEAVMKALSNKDVDKAFSIVHAVYPRPNTDQSAAGNIGSRGMPWVSVWVEKEHKDVIKESGYIHFPFSIPRYQKTPGEVYGRGRGDIAFSDNQTLDTAKKMGLEDWALKIRPPIMMSHGSVIGGKLRLIPAGVTPVRSQGRKVTDMISTFQTGSSPEVSILKEEELRKSIRQIFFVDQILALLEIDKSSAKQMTAFEVAKKIELLFRLLGPVYGRMEWEFLTPTVDNIFDLMLQGGALPPPPDEIFESDGTIDVEYQNPLSKAQRAGDVEAINLALQDLAPLVEVFPDIFDGIDPDKLRKHVLDVRGVPASRINTDKNPG